MISQRILSYQKLPSFLHWCCPKTPAIVISLASIGPNYQLELNKIVIADWSAITMSNTIKYTGCTKDVVPFKGCARNNSLSCDAWFWTSASTFASEASSNVSFYDYIIAIDMIRTQSYNRTCLITLLSNDLCYYRSNSSKLMMLPYPI